VSCSASRSTSGTRSSALRRLSFGSRGVRLDPAEEAATSDARVREHDVEAAQLVGCFCDCALELAPDDLRQCLPLKRSRPLWRVKPGVLRTSSPTAARRPKRRRDQPRRRLLLARGSRRRALLLANSRSIAPLFVQPSFHDGTSIVRIRCSCCVATESSSVAGSAALAAKAASSGTGVGSALISHGEPRGG